jgi:hypothetical protein
MSTAKELTIIEKVKQDPAVIDVQNRVNEVKVLHQEVFQRGVHYGAPYKGSKNDTLLKPGATFLQQKYGLREHHERIETTIHVDTADLSKSYIIIQDRCRIFDSNGVELAQADAACTTFEDKHLFRGGAGKVCPTCGGSVMASKYADRQTGDMGWYCKDCKANFHSTDKAITEQDTTKRVNSNPLNLLDTIVAMAQKRASVRSTIKATGVDALFSPGDGVTVDFYDDVFDGDDLTKAGEQLIQVVQKNTPTTNEKATPSDLAQDNASEVVQSTATVKTPAERLGTPSKQTVAPKAAQTTNYNIGELKTRALKEIYENNVFHMNKSLDKLNAAGLLPNTLTLEQALEVIRTRKEVDVPA